MEQFWQNLVMEFTRTFIRDNRWKVFWTGFLNTLMITVVAALIGIVIGVVVSVVHYIAESAKKKKKKTLGRYVVMALDKILAAYVSIMRGTPLAIQLTIMAFIIMAGFPNKIVVCCVAFGINSGAYVSEVIRGGINSVDIGQMEAGRSVGLPALCNEGIAVLKETSIVGLISVVDLTRASDLVRSRTLSPYFPLISVAVIYYLLVAGLSAAVSRLERRLAQSDRH